jgi:hypothetical protein
MNKSILINAGWIAIAGATFAIGRMTAGPGEGAPAEPQQGARHTGLSSIVEADRDQLPNKVAGAVEGDFLSKYIQAEHGSLSKEAMTAAMREAMSESDPIKRALMMAQLMQNLTAENVQEALAALRESPNRRENFQYLALLQYSWGKIDGKAAIDAAIESGAGGRGGRGGGFGAMSVISGWATTDPDGAKAWVDGQEDGREKMMYMGGLVDGLAKTDPAAATAYVLEMSAPEEGEEGRGGFDIRSRYISNIAGEMLKKGVDTASTWAAGLPEGTLKASALSEVAQFYSRQDVEAAAEWIETYADSEDANRAVREVADRWARESPAEAAKWLAELSGDTQGSAMRSVFSEWADKEPLEASQYLATMEASTSRDSAVSGFSRELAGEDPSSAMEWAESIADKDLRTSTELSVARQWYRDEPEAAQAWAQENLSVEDQGAITQRERGGGGGDRRGGRGGR